MCLKCTIHRECQSKTILPVEEPYIHAQIITKTEFLGNVMKLCIDKRGILKNQIYIASDRIELTFDMPLSEIVFDFYDKLKSISKGYASFDYHLTDYKPAKLIKLDILLNGDTVDALSALIHVDHAESFGRKICVKLKELIPRQQFEIAIQAAIGSKIIARKLLKLLERCYSTLLWWRRFEKKKTLG